MNVAPILGYQVRSRAVYLPKGAGWTNVWTKTQLSGDKLSTPMHRLNGFPSLCEATMRSW